MGVRVVLILCLTLTFVHMARGHESQVMMDVKVAKALSKKTYLTRFVSDRLENTGNAVIY